MPVRFIDHRLPENSIEGAVCSDQHNKTGIFNTSESFSLSGKVRCMFKIMVTQQFEETSFTFLAFDSFLLLLYS